MLVFRVVHKYKSEIYIQFRPPDIRLSMEGFCMGNPIQDRLKRCQISNVNFPFILLGVSPLNLNGIVNEIILWSRTDLWI